MIQWTKQIGDNHRQFILLAQSMLSITECSLFTYLTKYTYESDIILYI